ncbi:MAG: hypothetical protein LKF79_03395 [Solobacterium sp.]|jgi:hypothetical protein|nr:hypothetical protein [Solobacterium sp.]MCH4222289.1 hypothetical protein [Solobacterium sp.]MCH4265670.1 hypothetical protein [Solobacterium sp.]
MSELRTQRDEIGEAVGAAEVALSHLYKAHDMLKSAGNWGVVDILGGGMLTTFVKHNKMDNARNELQMAKNALQDFSRELRDLDRVVDISCGDDFMDFADYFFDGAMADFLVQSRISDTRRRVEDAIVQVERVHNELLDLEERSGY